MSELINNRENRIRNLKEIILHLHQGLPPEQVKKRLAELVREADAGEVAAMEQELMAEGMSVEEVRSMCDLHSQVLRDILRTPPAEKPLPAGHPVETFRRENRALEQVVDGMRQVLQQLDSATAEAGPSVSELLDQWRQRLNQLMDVDKHYARKENLLFSVLERHGITGPSKVMWAKDDEVRDLLRALEAALHEEASLEEWQVVARTVAEPALNAVEEMITKEEKVLLPMSMDTLTDDEWAEIWAESPRYGWCLAEPGKEYQPPAKTAPVDPLQLPRERVMAFPTGSLSFQQLLGIFSSLPVDLTFVDADNRVAFFSEGPDRIFSRSPAILGRQVQHCHPPRSVHVVERIVADFREKRQNVAEFWIQHQGRFVHIRYFAVRDENGAYIGTLEVTQDVTGIRALSGERRLLEYGEPSVEHGDPGAPTLP